MKKTDCAVVAVVLGLAAVIIWPTFARWRENQRRAAAFAKLPNHLYLSGLQYRSDAPPLLTKYYPDGSKKYFWYVEGREIYKRTEQAARKQRLPALGAERAEDQAHRRDASAARIIFR